MKIKKNLLWSTVFILFFLTFDRGFFLIFKGLEGHFYKKKDMKRIFVRKHDFNKHFLEIPKDTYNTLIMGSSRTYRGIHPYYFYKRLQVKAFKIAKAGVWPKFNYYFYQEYKKIAGIPQVVIYGLDYFMFRKKSQLYFLQAVRGGDGKNLEEYASGLSLLISNKGRIDDFLKTYIDHLENQFDSAKDKSKDIRQIDPFVGYPLRRQLNDVKPVRYKRFRHIRYPGEEGIYLKMLLEDLEKDGVTVALVYLPEHIGTYESHFQRDIFRADIQQLIAPFKNVYVYDYNHPGKFSLDHPRYFQDGGWGRTNSHLSKTGARILNRLLIQDVKKHYKKVF